MAKEEGCNRLDANPKSGGVWLYFDVYKGRIDIRCRREIMRSYCRSAWEVKLQSRALTVFDTKQTTTNHACKPFPGDKPNGTRHCTHILRVIQIYGKHLG